jgi:hypothetical protein
MIVVGGQRSQAKVYVRVRIAMGKGRQNELG